MKMFLDGILVVEGKEDASYLSNYIESEIVVVNGFEIDKDIVEYLSDKKVIALLDPDDAGKKIRNKLNDLLPNIINVSVDVDKCNRGIKNGVAECEINEILSKLGPFCLENQTFSSDIKESDIYNLGLVGDKEKRAEVCKKLKLGKCNAKQLYKRLVYNGIALEKLERIVKEI